MDIIIWSPPFITPSSNSKKKLTDIMYWHFAIILNYQPFNTLLEAH